MTLKMKSRPDKKRNTARPPHFEEVDPRVLYSADLVPVDAVTSSDQQLVEETPEADASYPLLEDGDEVAAGASDNAAIKDTPLLLGSLDSGEEAPVYLNESGAPDAASEAPDLEIDRNARLELVFVNDNVADLDGLIATLQSESSAQLEIITLDTGRDGLTQLLEALSRFESVDALHLIGHGDDASFQLGSLIITSDNLAQFEDTFRALGSNLAADADVLFYGCHIAGSNAGKTMMTTLGDWTGADIAASNDLTGSRLLGGDWVLEFTVGSIETGNLSGATSDADWHNVLSSFFVTNTNDSGAGSLRQAIIDANASGGADLIVFDSGLLGSTITLGTALPDVTGVISIDGSDGGGNPAIVLNGNGTVPIGILLNGSSGGSTIRGLVLQNFTDAGISIGTSGNTIAGNFIGTNSSGTSAAGGLFGVVVWGGSGNVIGGMAAADRNVISGHANSGVILNSPSSATTVIGNYIGTDVTGGLPLAAGNGVYVTGANNIIGGSSAAERNVISGNDYGIHLSTAGATGNTVLGNFIGSNSAGSAALGNSLGGVFIESGASNNVIGGIGAGAGNLIAYNGEHGMGAGVLVQDTTTTGNSIRGNAIFSNAGLNIDLGNTSADGADANDTGDGDSGGNTLENWAVPGSIGIADNGDMSYVLDTTTLSAGSYTVDFYTGSNRDRGSPDAARYLGSVSGIASGNAALAGTLSGIALAPGDYVVITVTDSSGNTSELSSYAVVVDSDAGGSAPLDVVATTSSEGGLTLNTAGNGSFLQAELGNSLFSGQSSVTFELVFSVDTPGATMTTLLSYATAGFKDELFIGINSAGNLVFRTSTNSSATTSLTPPVNLLDGNPHHIAVTWENVNGYTYFYMDGEEVTLRNDYRKTTTIDAGGTLIFGQAQKREGELFDAGYTFAGTLYEARIFEGVRSGGQIGASWNSSLPYDEPGLLASWDFGQYSTDGVVIDQVAGHDLVLNQVAQSGFTSDTPALTLEVAENAASGTVVGTLSGVDAERAQLIASLLASNPALQYSAETGKFYELVNTAGTWSAANTAAQSTLLNSVNGELVTIGSSFENQLVQTRAATIGADIWIGATDDITEGTWIWQHNDPTVGDQIFFRDGVLLDQQYANWQAGEPSNSTSLDPSGEDYAYLDNVSGQWNDVHAAATFPVYMVQWDADAVLDAAAGENQSLTYSITSQTVTGAFEIDADSGEIRVLDGSLLDFEAQPVHSITVNVTDIDGHPTTKVFAITLKDITEAATAPTDLSAGIELNLDGGTDAYLYTSNGGTLLGGLGQISVDMTFSSDSLGLRDTLLSYATAAQSNELMVWVNDSGVIELRVNDGIVPSTLAFATLADGAPHTLSYTWDNTAGDWSLYLDGQLHDSGTGLKTGYTLATGGTLVFGQEQDGVNGGYDVSQNLSGTYYDVRLWNEVRTASRIAQLTNHKFDAANLPATLIANWQMDGFNGANEVVDLVSGENLAIGHATGPGFANSTPTHDLHIDENRRNGSVIGHVIPTTPETAPILVKDGQFLGITPTSNIWSATGTLGDWTVSSGGGVDIFSTSNYAAPDGGRVINLDGASPSTISQTLTTVAGQEYQVVFDMNGDFSAGEAIKNLRVSAGGSSVDFAMSRPAGWVWGDAEFFQTRTMTFTATSTSTTLSFASLEGAGSQYGPLISNISVAEVPAGVTALLSKDPSLSYDAATDKFYRYVDTNVNFSSALSAATGSTLNGIDGQLLTIHSAYENAKFVEIAVNKGKGIWLGATDANMDGNWNWLSGATESAEQFWVGGSGGAPAGGFYAPTFSISGSPTEQYVRLLQQGFWADTTISGSFAYVIEWNASEVLSNFTYSLTDDAGGRFAVDPDSGAISVADTSLIDYETAATHNITVMVTDASGASYSEIMTIMVDNQSGEPSQSIPIDQTTNENVAIVFSTANGNAININDTDGATNLAMQVSLEVGHGTLTLAQTTGLTIVDGADGSALLVIQGTESDLNAALDGLVYTPDLDYYGADTLTVTTSPDASLEGLYSFEGGNAADQSAGTTQNGTLNGDATTVVDGSRGEVLTLDGTRDFVEIASTFANPVNATLSAWVYLDAGAPAGDVISIGNVVTLRADDAGGTQAFFWDGTVWQYTGAGIDIAGTGWRHLAYTYDDASNTQVLYIDGEVVASTSHTASIDYGASTGVTTIGAHANVSFGGYDFKGKLDDARIYTRALSADEIAALAKSQTGVSDSIGISIAANNLAPVISSLSTPIINEFHYDNSGTDAGEAIEVAGPAGTDLTGWTLLLYNGSDATVYNTIALSGTLTDQTNGIGFTVVNLPVNGLQNGNPDGIALVDNGGNVIEFLSYGGSFTAVGGAAGGLTSTDIGIVESGATPVGNSLQRTGTGPVFSWTAAANTLGAVNTGQIFSSSALPAESVVEDTPLTFSVATGNAIVISDPDAGGNTLLLTLSVSNGTLTLATTSGLASVSGNGSNSISLEGTLTALNAALDGLSYQGVSNFNGSDTLNLTADDQGNSGVGGALTDSASVAITVTAVNDEQTIIANAGLSLDEAATATVTSALLSTTDIEQTAANLVYTITATTTNGTLRLNGVAIGLSDTFTQDDIDNNRLSYQHNGSETLSDSFGFSVDDGVGAASTGTFSITINAINDAPVITSDGGAASAAITAAENQTSVTTVVATDAENDTPAFSITGGADQSLFSINSAGVLTFNSAADFESPADGNLDGVYEVEITVTDGNGGSDVQMISVTVTDINEAPTAANNTVTTAEDTIYTFVASDFGFNDVDGDALASINVTNLESLGALKLNGVDVTLNQLVSRLDIDAGWLSFAAVADANGSSYDSFGFSVNDGALDSASAYTMTVDVTAINDSPLIAVNTGSTVAEGSGGNVITTAMLNEGDIDDSGAGLTYTITSDVVNGTLRLGGVVIGLGDSFTQANIDSGLVTYDHDGSQTASDSFDFSLADGGEHGAIAATGSVNFTVTNVNDAPVNSVPGAQTVDEDLILAIGGISVSDADDNIDTVQLSVSNGTLSVTLQGSATIVSGSNASATLSLSGSLADINATLTTLRYQGNQHFNGSDTLAVVSTDSDLAVDGDSVAITVNPVNDEQSLDTNLVLTLNEGATATINSALLSTSDIEQSASSITYVIDSIPLNGALRLNGLTLTLSDTFTQDDIDNNRLTYRHDDSETLSDSFNFTVDDGTGTTTTNTFAITITPVNEAPTAISPGSFSINENLDTTGGHSLGSLSSADVDSGDSFTYSIVGGADAAYFNIGGAGGDELLLDHGLLDFENQSSYSVAVRTTDSGGLWHEETLTVTVNDLNEVPVFTSSATVTASQNAPYSDSISASDPDSDPLTLSATTLPSWLTLLDNGDGTASLSGTPGAGDVGSHSVVLEVSDGLLTATQSFSITVSDVNDAPVLVPYTPAYAMTEDGATSSVMVSTLLGTSVTDPDAGAVEGIAIFNVTGSGSTLEYRIDGGSWIAIGTGSLSANAALLLKASDEMRFTPATDNGGTLLIDYRAWDQSSGIAGSSADVSVNGGSSAFSSATDRITVSITSQNDAPTLDNSGNLTAITINEDEVGNAGQTVASLLASDGGTPITDVDAGAQQGIAITSRNNGSGIWQYSLDGGSTWTNVGTVSENSALLLRATDLVRFDPGAVNGTVKTFTFRAWDQSSGSAGSKVDVSSNGGTSAFSMSDETVSITVDAVNDAPTLDNTRTVTLDSQNEDSGVPVGAVGTAVSAIISTSIGGNAADVDAGSVAGIAITAADTANGNWWYSIDNGGQWFALGAVSDGNARLLAANATTRLYFEPAANYNGTLNNAVTFRAWDQTAGSNGGVADISTIGTGGTTAFSADSDTADLTIDPVNDAPVITSDGSGATASIAVDENQTSVTSVTSSDIDGGPPVYSLGSSADATLFSIDSVTGTVSFIMPPDFETFGDANTDGVYELLVEVSDGVGGVDSQAISISINDVNEAPSLITLSSNVVAENTDTSAGFSVGTFTTSDVDAADSATYSVIGGPDGARFSIGGVNNDELILTDGMLDFENRASYQVTVKVTDSGGLSHNETFVITVSDQNEAPRFVSSAPVVATEDLGYAYSIVTSDPDALASLTITPSVALPGWLTLIDNGDGTATLSGTPGDADVGNHNVSLTVSDGSLSATQNFTISVSNVNDAPVITSDGGGATASFSVDENQTSVTTVTSTDIDGGSPAYSLGSSADAARFSIDPVSGALRFNSAPDFENPDDANADGVYDIVVQVSDGLGGVDTQTMSISVNDVNEAPSVSLQNIVASVPEDADLTLGLRVADIVVSDDAPGTPTLSLVGSDAVLFEIIGNELRLRSGASLDFETLPQLDVTVEVDDITVGGTPDDRVSLTVQISDANEYAPVVPNQIFTLDENSLDGTVVGNMVASDADLAQSLSYAITAGNDTGAFQIDAGTGEISVADGAQLDFDTTPVFNLTISVSDNGSPSKTTQASVDILLNNLNDLAPDLVDAAVTVAENSAAGMMVYDFNDAVSGNDQDTDGQALLWSIISGDDAGIFTLDSATGVIRIANAAALDYETAAVYVLQIGASDGSFSDAAQLTIQIENLNEAPRNQYPATLTVDEDTALALTGANSISISDVDVGGAIMEVALHASHGKLTLADSSGLTLLTGITSVDNLAIRGSQSAINAALQTLSFLPDENYYGQASLLIISDDLGNSGTGSPLQDSDLITISVVSVNDAPELVAPDSPLILQPNQQFDFSTTVSALLSAADVDASNSMMAVSLSIENAALTVNLANSGAQVAGNGTSQISLTGTLNQLNVALRSLLVTPPPGFSGALTLSVVLIDYGNGSSDLTRSASTTVQIDVLGMAVPTDADTGVTEEQNDDKQTTSAAKLEPGPTVAREKKFNEAAEQGKTRHAGITKLRSDSIPERAASGFLTELLSSGHQKEVTLLSTRIPDGMNGFQSLLQQLQQSRDGGVEKVIRHFGTRPVNWNSETESHGQTLELNLSDLGSMGLTVGGILWMVRGTGLLSSLLMSYPAWRNVDPLPVLLAEPDEKPSAPSPAKPDKRIKQSLPDNRRWMIEST